MSGRTDQMLNEIVQKCGQPGRVAFVSPNEPRSQQAMAQFVAKMAQSGKPCVRQGATVVFGPTTVEFIALNTEQAPASDLHIIHDKDGEPN